MKFEPQTALLPAAQFSIDSFAYSSDPITKKFGESIFDLTAPQVVFKDPTFIRICNLKPITRGDELQCFRVIRIEAEFERDPWNIVAGK